MSASASRSTTVRITAAKFRVADRTGSRLTHSARACGRRAHALDGKVARSLMAATPRAHRRQRPQRAERHRARPAIRAILRAQQRMAGHVHRAPIAEVGRAQQSDQPSDRAADRAARASPGGGVHETLGAEARRRDRPARRGRRSRLSRQGGAPAAVSAAAGLEQAASSLPTSTTGCGCRRSRLRDGRISTRSSRRPTA